MKQRIIHCQPMAPLIAVLHTSWYPEQLCRMRKLCLKLRQCALSAEPFDGSQRVVMPLLREGCACICTHGTGSEPLSERISVAQLHTMLTCPCSNLQALTQSTDTVGDNLIPSLCDVKFCSSQHPTCHQRHIVVLVAGLPDSALHTLICHAASQDEELLLKAPQDVVHIGGCEDIRGRLWQDYVVWSRSNALQHLRIW